MGACSRWALIRGWALFKFSTFLASVVYLFCNKTINGNNKTRRCNKARSLQNTLKKTPSSVKYLISTYSIFEGRGEGEGGGGLFEAGRFLTFSAFRMSAYSRWALIRS